MSIYILALQGESDYQNKGAFPYSTPYSVENTSCDCFKIAWTKRFFEVIDDIIFKINVASSNPNQM